MLRIAVIYFSATEATHSLALAIREGASGTGVAEVFSHRIRGTEIEHGRFRNGECLELADSADAVIFGSPTYMGGPAAEFKAFADASGSRWEKQHWAGKVAAGFTVGANPNGDQLATLQYFSILAAQQGMLWVGLDIAGGYDPLGRNRLGTQLGLAVHCISPLPDESDIATAKHLGARVATVARRVCQR